MTEEEESMRDCFRRWAGRGILWLGTGLVILIAIPTGLLFLLLAGVWTLTDRLTAALTEQET